jgi:hypothetical protein
VSKRLGVDLCMCFALVCAFVRGYTDLFDITLISTPLSFPVSFYDRSILHGLLSHMRVI